MKPKHTRTDTLGETFEHPAYGMINYGRVSGRQRLVDSDLEHNNYIHLQIYNAQRKRSMHEDKFFSQSPIVEIYLTEQQWATFISSPNTSGVPCTFRRKPKNQELEIVPEVQEDDRHELSKKELKEYSSQITSELKETLENITKLISNPTIRKKDLTPIITQLERAVSAVNNNLPFHVKQHERLMESTLQEAKAGLEGYLNNKIYSLGLEELKKQAPRIAFEGNILSISNDEEE